MSGLGTTLTELLTSLLGHAAGEAAAPPVERLGSQLRRRLTVPHLLLAWGLALGAMLFGWRIGTSSASSVLQALAVLLWIATPVGALVLTGLWFGRRGA